MLLHHFVREQFEGSAPAYLIDKPSPGTGAGYLVDVLSLISLGTAAPVQTYSADDEEMRKVITTKLLQGTSLIVFDNIDSKLRGGALAALLTSEVWTDRKLGGNESFQTSVSAQIVMTANNIVMEDQQVRRILPIRLDSKSATPTEGRVFRHVSLKTWVKENRGEMIWACLVIVQNWFMKGKSISNMHFASFEHYAQTMGGVLEAAGVEGFMSNLPAFRGAKKADSDVENAFMQSLYDFSQSQKYESDFPTKGSRESVRGVSRVLTAKEIWKNAVEHLEDGNGIDLGVLGIRVETLTNKAKQVSTKLSRFLGKTFMLLEYDSSKEGGARTQGSGVELPRKRRSFRFGVDGITDGVKRYGFTPVD